MSSLDNWFAPTRDEGDEDNLGFVIDEHGRVYSPNEVRDLASWLNHLADTADIEAHG